MIPANNAAPLPAAHDAKPSRIPAKRAVKSSRPNTKAKSETPRRGSKTSKMIALLKRPGGAALEQLQKVTGWQAHSVRGFLSGTLKKKMGLRIHSSKHPDGHRVYRITSK